MEEPTPAERVCLRAIELYAGGADPAAAARFAVNESLGRPRDTTSTPLPDVARFTAADIEAAVAARVVPEFGVPCVLTAADVEAARESGARSAWAAARRALVHSPVTTTTTTGGARIGADDSVPTAVGPPLSESNWQRAVRVLGAAEVDRISELEFKAGRSRADVDRVLERAALRIEAVAVAKAESARLATLIASWAPVSGDGVPVPSVEGVPRLVRQ